MRATLLVVTAILTAGWLAGRAETAHAQAAPAATPAPAVTYEPPKRRRIIVMRHGDVAYFDQQGKAVPDPDVVVLTSKGKDQADAAGRWLAGLGFKRFDRVLSSNLPRTVETAERVLASGGIAGKVVPVPALREIKAGGASRSTPVEKLPELFLSIAKPNVAPDTTFIGGETIGQMQTRVYGALDALLAEEGWDTALLVLHAVVNTAIVSRAVTGEPSYFGRLESGAGCLHILDAAKDWSQWVLRAYNVCPMTADYDGGRETVIEKLLIMSLKGRQAK